MKKSTLLNAKPGYLVRFAHWLKLDIKGMRHKEIAERIYFHLLYN